MKDKSRPWAIRLLPTALLFVVIIFAHGTGALDQISPESIAKHHQQLHGFIGQQPVAAVCVYIAVYALSTGACLPVALVLTLAAGMYLGVLEAGLATVVGSTIGAMGTYFAARSAFAPTLRSCARSSSKFETALHNVKRDAFGYIIIARLLPLFPSSAATIAAGVANTPIRTFTAATALGAIPPSFVYSSMGAGLEGGMQSWNGSIWGLLGDPRVLSPLIALAALAVAASLMWAGLRIRLAHACS